LSGCSPVCFTLNSTSTVTNPSNIIDYTWTFSNGATYSSSDPVISDCFENNTSNTIFIGVELTATSNLGCTNSYFEPSFIEVYQNPIASFNYTPEQPDVYDATVNFINTSLYADNYNWNISGYGNSTDFSPIADFPLEPATYDVELITTTNEGCSDTANAIVNVEDRIIFYVPNTFTPDFDNYNQYFSPIFTAGFDPYDYNLLIFNRYGEVIFESNDASIGWDGTYGAESNEFVKDGTYVWKIEFKETMSDKRHLHTGHVNLIR
jgi:gliding motility-associated-like protein